MHVQYNVTEFYLKYTGYSVNNKCQWIRFIQWYLLNFTEFYKSLKFTEYSVILTEFNNLEERFQQVYYMFTA